MRVRRFILYTEQTFYTISKQERLLPVHVLNVKIILTQISQLRNKLKLSAQNLASKYHLPVNGTRGLQRSGCQSWGEKIQGEYSVVPECQGRHTINMGALEEKAEANHRELPMPKATMI